jgi:hypothetical protein
MTKTVITKAVQAFRVKTAIPPTNIEADQKFKRISAKELVKALEILQDLEK